MATYSNTLAWKTPWMEEPGRLQSMGLLRVGHDWATSLSLFTCMHWRRKWQPTPVFLPGKCHGQRSLVSYSPPSCKESDTTEHACTHRQEVAGPSVSLKTLTRELWLISLPSYSNLTQFPPVEFWRVLYISWLAFFLSEFCSALLLNKKLVLNGSAYFAIWCILWIREIFLLW